MRKASFFTSLLTLIICAAGSAYGQMPALQPLPGTGTLAAGSDSFTFVVAGDNRPATKCDSTKTPPCAPPTPTTGQIFAAARKIPAAFVLWAGDSIYGKEPDNESYIESEYKAFLALAADAGAPVFNAPGNHEMDDQKDVPNATMQAFYPKYMSQPYGSFDYGNSHFIALNTEEIAPAGTKKSPRAKTDSGTTLDPGYVSKQQLDALAADLEANKDKAHIFIFMHHPIKPYTAADGLNAASAQALVKLFSKYNNIEYVLAAHEHLYFNPQSKSGAGKPPGRADLVKLPPYYLVTGGAGAPLNGAGKKNKPSISFFHYLVFTVNKNQVTVKLVKLRKS